MFCVSCRGRRRTPHSALNSAYAVLPLEYPGNAVRKPVSRECVAPRVFPLCESGCVRNDSAVVIPPTPPGARNSVASPWTGSGSLGTPGAGMRRFAPAFGGLGVRGIGPPSQSVVHEPSRPAPGDPAAEQHWNLLRDWVAHAGRPSSSARRFGSPSVRECSRCAAATTPRRPDHRLCVRFVTLRNRGQLRKDPGRPFFLMIWADRAGEF